MLIGEGADIPGPYSEQLARSKFCIVAPGDMLVVGRGWCRVLGCYREARLAEERYSPLP